MKGHTITQNQERIARSLRVTYTFICKRPRHRIRNTNNALNRVTLDRVMRYMENDSYSYAQSSIGSINVTAEGNQIDFVAVEIPPVETLLVIGEQYSAIKVRGSYTNADETPISVSIVGVIIGVCGASVLIVGGAFNKLQGKYKEQKLSNPVEANPTEDVHVEISVLYNE